MIVTYDYTDIATGTGIITYYAMGTETSAGEDFALTTTKTYANPAGTKRTSAGTTTRVFDLTPFSIQRRVKGTAVFSANVGGYYEGAINATLTVQIKKYDGSTETDISSVITSQTMTTVNAVPFNEFVTMKIPLTETVFHKGDLLRMEVKLITNGGTGDYGFTVGHDPMNQPFGHIDPSTKGTTVMAINMPFKLDI